MNRRIFTLLLAIAMILAFAACKKNDMPQQTVPGVVHTPDVNDGDLEHTPKETTSAETETAAETEVSEETEATEETTEDTKATEATEPEATKPEETKPNTETTAPSTEPEEEVTVPSVPAEMTKFEWYNSLTGEEQMAFMQSFASVPDFFDWYNNAKAEHEELHPDIEIGDGVVDLGGILGGNG